MAKRRKYLGPWVVIRTRYFRKIPDEIANQDRRARRHLIFADRAEAEAYLREVCDPDGYCWLLPGEYRRPTYHVRMVRYLPQDLLDTLTEDDFRTV